jgi:hypothetical protein
MSRMIRCIEGHVFDADKHDKCPECGWAPKKAAKKEKRGSDDGVSVGALFASLVAVVDRLLQSAGMKVSPQVSAGIVYGAAILFCVGAVAYPGSPLWPGNWGSSDTSPKKEATTKENSKPADHSPPNPGPSNDSSKANNDNLIGPSDSPKPNLNPNPAPQKARLPATITVGGNGSSGFGAIAYSLTTGSWGDSYGWRDGPSAATRALAGCQSHGPGCQVIVLFYRQCGAVVSDDKAGVTGPGMGPTPQLAIRDAFAACENNNGKNCEFVRVTCTR